MFQKMENRIAQLKADADKLLDKAGAMCPASLVNDPDMGVNTDAWERYKTIINGFIAAKKDMSGVLDVKYLQSPDMEDDFASVTVKLDKACTLHSDARTALALAAALADMVTMTTDGNKMWMSFTVNAIWKEDGNNAYHTNWNCGLAHYWLGHYQSSYIHWRRFVAEGHGVDDLINQLSPKALDSLEKYIQYKKSA